MVKHCTHNVRAVLSINFIVVYALYAKCTGTAQIAATKRTCILPTPLDPSIEYRVEDSTDVFDMSGWCNRDITAGEMRALHAREEATISNNQKKVSSSFNLRKFVAIHDMTSWMHLVSHSFHTFYSYKTLVTVFCVSCSFVQYMHWQYKS